MMTATTSLAIRARGLAASILLLTCVACASGGVSWQRLRIVEQPTIAYEIHAQEARACADELAVTLSSREPAAVELALLGVGTAKQILANTYPKGTNRLLARLPAIAPSSRYRLHARFADGEVQVQEGTLGEQYRRLDSLPLAQTVVSGVALADGHLVTSQTELALGESSDLGEVERGYASTLADWLGPLGYGWSSSLHQVIRRNSCGDFIVMAGNQAMWFRENAAGELAPTRGFHGTLRREGERTLAFYGKSGLRWAFEQLVPSSDTWWLTEVVSPAAEPTRFVYGRESGQPLLAKVLQPGGGALEVHHRRLVARGRWGMVISEWRSPESSVAYTYDEDGRLSTATESSAAGTTTWKYDYAPIGGIPVLAREESRNEAGELLYGRDFRYEPSTLLVARPGGGDYAVPTPRVTRIVDSGGGDTRFAYSGPADGRRWQNASTTTVDDGERAVYRFDADGATIATETAKGVIARVWDSRELLCTLVVAEDGTRTSYEYDRHGNLTQLTAGEQVTRYRYYSPDRFDPPYIKNLVSEIEGPEGRRWYCYDRHGRQVPCPNA